MHVLGIEALDKIPLEIQEEMGDQRRIIGDTASKIIDSVFQPSSLIVQQIV